MSVKVTIETDLDDGPFHFRGVDLIDGNLYQWNHHFVEHYGGAPLIVVKAYEMLVSIRNPHYTWSPTNTMTRPEFRPLPPGTKVTWEIEED